MTFKILAGAFAAALLLTTSQTADAGIRVSRAVSRAATRVPARVVNSYQRDVRQIQRQTSRSFNQLDRNYSRAGARYVTSQRAPVRYAPSRYAPRSSSVYIGGQRGGVFLNF